jgi:hypothetical protein
LRHELIDACGFNDLEIATVDLGEGFPGQFLEGAEFEFVLALMLLQKAQTRTDDFAGALILAAVNSLSDEIRLLFGEIHIPSRHACIIA